MAQRVLVSSMGAWAATVTFPSREAAQSFLGAAREVGAHAMLHMDGDRPWSVTVLGDAPVVDAALARAEGGRLVRREPAPPTS